MSRKRPPSNFLILDEDVIPKVDPTSGDLAPPPTPTPTGLPSGHFTPAPPDPPEISADPETGPSPHDPPSADPGLDTPTGLPFNKAASADLLPQARFPSDVHYEARITIVDAWQYPGQLRAAPEWVDRNWVAYADWDPIREIEPGPCLRVPSTAGVHTICRVGDYVARQEVKITRELSDIRVEVWNRDQFEKLFYPVDTRGPKTIEHATTTTTPADAAA